MTRPHIAILGIAALALIADASQARAQDAGTTAFKRYCFICHSTEPGKNKLGPSLAGVVGRKAGSVPGFAYSEANKNSGVTWDKATLDTYLTDPRKFMPGTKMVFAGVKNADERKALINFLQQQK